jgi:hypothetical protein
LWTGSKRSHLLNVTSSFKPPLSLPILAEPSAVKKLGALENFRELHPKFPGTDSEWKSSKAKINTEMPPIVAIPAPRELPLYNSVELTKATSAGPQARHETRN